MGSGCRGIRGLRTDAPNLFRERAVASDMGGGRSPEQDRQYRSWRGIWPDQRIRQSDAEADGVARSQLRGRRHIVVTSFSTASSHIYVQDSSGKNRTRLFVSVLGSLPVLRAIR